MADGIVDDSDRVANKPKFCKICNDSIRVSGVKCNGANCVTVVHAKCFEACSRVFAMDKCTWRCKNCVKSGPSSNEVVSFTDYALLRKENECLTREKEIINRLVSETSYINQLQKQKIEALEEKLSTSNTDIAIKSQERSVASYSAIAKKPIEKSAVLLIKSKNASCSNKQIESEIKSRMNPGVKIINTKLIKGGMLINCESESALSKLKTTLVQEVGSTYHIAEPVKRNPRIIVYGVDKEAAASPECFIPEIINKNELNCNVSDIKFVTVLKYKNVVNLVLELNSALFKYVTDKGFLYIGWKRCYIKEHINLLKCYKCCAFGHYQNECKSDKLVCPRCSKDHALKDCKSDTSSCCNCMNYNEKRKSNFPTDHSSNDISCNVRNIAINQFKSRVNYG